MELRTNELFKSYLQEKTITKTPSPSPQVSEYRKNLQNVEQSILNKSVSTLCKIMENCQIQLQSSNDTMSKFLSKDSDYIMIQKKQLKDLFDGFMQEFTEFKNDVKNDMVLIKNITLETELKHQQPRSQKDVYNSQVLSQNKSSQKSIFSLKPLTPPSSLEALFEIEKNGGLDHKSNVQQASPSQKKINCQQQQYYPLSQCTKANNKQFTKTPSVSIKMQKRRKTINCKQTKPQKQLIPSKTTSITSNISHTQKWLDSLPLPPPPDECRNTSFNNVPTFHLKMKKEGYEGRGEISDNDSCKWSCKSIRTYKSSRKRGANFVKVDRVVRSETGWGIDDKRYHERKVKSEY